MIYDLASLAKPLVTAPLALAFLDLEADRRWALGFHERAEPLTVRQLLSHASGLLPWRPFTGEPVSAQLRRPVPEGAHALLRPATRGLATYSDLNYRLLAELLERETGTPFQQLGAAASGLSAWPWEPAPVAAPDGPDAIAWELAEPGIPLPPQGPGLPQDANARAGMRGHAGFAATLPQFRAALKRWSAQWAPRMAVESAAGEDRARWGLGLQMALDGPGRFGALLKRIPLGGLGVAVVEFPVELLDEAAPKLGPGEPCGWWFHLGFTGPALFYRPEDGACLGLLLHRCGPSGELIDAEQLRARRWCILERFTAAWA